MQRRKFALGGLQQLGLILVILLLAVILTLFSGTHEVGGKQVNNFLNPDTLLTVLTNASFFAIMAVGVTMIIITGGIDLSVGSVYAICGVSVALAIKGVFGDHADVGPAGFIFGLAVSCAVGAFCGFLNGSMMTGLGVHPFIITLGMMMVIRGVAFVMTQGRSINLPTSMISVSKHSFGFDKTLHPVPMVVMAIVTVLGWLYLTKTVAGRRVFAVGGNLLASKYSGLRTDKILIGVYALAGLSIGVAAFFAATYYGAASSGDGQGYELYVIASAVVGGASLNGGKGSVVSAMLGAVLIAMMRQAVLSLHFDQNYEQIIIGCAIIVAVVLDRFSAKMSAKRLVQAKQ